MDSDQSGDVGGGHEMTGSDGRAAPGPSPSSWLTFTHVGPWLGVLGLAAWIRWPSVGWLMFSSASSLAAFTGRPRGGPARSIAGVVVLAGVLAGLVGQGVSRRVAGDFDAYWTARSARAESAVDSRLQRLLERGDDAVARIGRFTSGSGERSPLEDLRQVRLQTGMTVVAVYGVDGEFLLWDGTHRGVVPSELRSGSVRYLYRDRPLFSYLYFTAPIPGGGTAMAGALMKANLPQNLESDPGDFVTAFRDDIGEDLRVLRADRATGEDVLDLEWEGDALFSVSLVRPTQEQRLRDVRSLWSRAVGALALMAWLLLAFTAGTERSERAAAALTPLGLAFLVPVGAAMGSPPLFTAADFVLPGPFPVSLERVLLVTIAAAVVAAAHTPPAARLGAIASGLAVLIVFPLASLALLTGAGSALLSGAEAKWALYQLGLALILTLLCLGAFRLGERAKREPPAQIPLSAAFALVLALSGFAVLGVWVNGSLPPWVTGAWCLPATLAAYGLSRVRGWRRVWLAWGSAAVLGSSAALAVSWGARVTAKMDAAELQLERLGVPVDPYLEYVLHRFVDVADSLDSGGAASAELLYESWVASGLAEEGTGVWLTVWSPGDLPEFEITIGVEGGRPGRADDFLDGARMGEPAFVRRFGEGEANYLLQVPLREGRVLTGVLPARRELSDSSPFGPLFGGLTALSQSPLTLVPVLEGDDVAVTDRTSWVRTPEGWEARRGIPYPDGAADAHYAFDLPGPILAAARGTLLVLGDVVLILLLWALGQFVLVGRRPAMRTWRNPFTSFRARVTWALFGFFLLSAALFGTLAFRTLSGATVRTAGAIAERVAADAAAFYRDVQGSMALLSGRVGADLLEYRAGELRGGSVDDLVELGLYDGWIPFDVNQRLESREELLETSLGNVGRREYLMAFRRLPDGDVVATQVPLEAGATALRQREVAELVAFVVVLGAGLSLSLALLVGRTLTSPIRTLQVASEKVGGGNLSVQLAAERADEFGSVFRAFNRMVLRIRRVRRDLVRTTRRTQAIVEETATGVVALDSMGRVSLVNPRAQVVLGGQVEIGRPLPTLQGPRGELVEWVGGCFRDGLREATREFELGDRRMRVRAREISRQGPGGLVLSIEDVTDELRTERILAWGEMARQVAHEVKNPLTPIKLSVQHIRRAWQDRPDDFGTVLDRNVSAILTEIDRLAAIASGFSRFGAPAAAGEISLEPIDVRVLSEEVLTLYRGGEEGPVRFDTRVPADLPMVSAREPEFKEVLLNLLENARVAIEGGGTVVIDAVSLPGEVEVRVRDDGSGIPPELLGRIFEPQFSTRSTGTGLGLAIVRRIVESWGGTVTAESGRGEGTVIRIHLKPWAGEQVREEGRDRKLGTGPGEPDDDATS